MPGAHALHLAAINGDVATIRLLLDRGVPVDVEAKGGDTPLICAAFYGRLKAISTLMDAGANPSNTSRQHGWAPLSAAAANKQTAAVKFLLLRGVDRKQEGGFGWTFLHTAASVGAIDIVDMARKAGLGLNALIGKDGRTALHVAAENNQAAMLRWLLDKGASIHAVTTKKATALHVSAAHGALDAARVLLDRGADIKRKEESGWVAVHTAAANNKADVLKLLLDRGAKLEPEADDGITPLHLAAWYGALEAAKVLIKAGAPVNGKGKLGRTPYELATQQGKSAVAKYLKSVGGR